MQEIQLSQTNYSSDLRRKLDGKYKNVEEQTAATALDDCHYATTRLCSRFKPPLFVACVKAICRRQALRSSRKCFVTRLGFVFTKNRKNSKLELRIIDSVKHSNAAAAMTS